MTPITAPTYHVSVMLRESIDALVTRPDGIYADLTFGGGGHAREILSRLSEDGSLYAFDQDADAERNVPEGDDRFHFVRSNFRYLRNWMRYYGVEALDGVLADLGVSSHHFDDETRGFSFRFDSPLDMRMNGRGGMTAADVLANYDEAQLARLFALYGELKNARRIAASIVRRREQSPLLKVSDLLETVEGLLPPTRQKKEMAKVFQALRIEVNHELDALQEMLAAAADLLRPEGRLVVLTYHSLEDRMVKNMMRAGNCEGTVSQDFYGNLLAPLRQVGKPTAPSAAEQQQNPRSRSAKLRVAEKLPL